MYPYVRYDAPKGSKNRNNCCNIARHCNINNTTTTVCTSFLFYPNIELCSLVTTNE